MRRATRSAIALLALLAWGASQAAVGALELPARGEDSGFDRALVPQAHARITAFFRRRLLP